MRKIFIPGAASGIARETARILAPRGHSFFLAARNKDVLESLAQELTDLGAKTVGWRALDLANMADHSSLVEEADRFLQGMNTVLLAYGTLGDQDRSEKDWDYALDQLTVNFTSAASLLTRIANLFQERGAGCIAAISSVAGDRGRGSNYLYGTAKGALSLFLQGLRNRLYKHGVQVLTIKPGFVNTPMTAHLEQGPLFVEPSVVARGIVKAMDRGKSVVYLPARWRLIMMVIRSIPEWLFKRLSL